MQLQLQPIYFRLVSLNQKLRVRELILVYLVCRTSVYSGITDDNYIAKHPTIGRLVTHLFFKRFPI